MRIKNFGSIWGLLYPISPPFEGGGRRIFEVRSPPQIRREGLGGRVPLIFREAGGDASVVPPTEWGERVAPQAKISKIVAEMIKIL